MKTARSITLILLVGCASVRSTHPFSPNDSLTLAQAAAHASLQARQVSAGVCILAHNDSTGSQAGQAFVREIETTARTLSTPSPSAASVSLQLLRLSGRDTVEATVRFSGSDAPDARSFWINDMALRFVRAPASGQWTLIDRKAAYFADFISDGSGTAVAPRCLNGGP